MANWNNPVLTSLYTDHQTILKDRDLDLAKGMDPAKVTVTNPVADMVRWNSANGRWEIYNGSTWGALAATYNINVSHLGGNAAALYALLAGPAFSGVPTAPTASAGTNTTQLATTAFVTAAFFPSGTRMLFQQTSAPTGWTKESNSTYDDAALRIVTGSVGVGGATGFNTVFGAGKTTGSYTLTTTDIPSHLHTVSITSGTNSVDHTHSGTTGTNSVDHTHSGTTGTNSVDHTHTIPTRDSSGGLAGRVHDASSGTSGTINTGVNSADHTHSFTTGVNSADHTHTITTGNNSVDHTHSVSGNTGNAGGGGSHSHTLSLEIKYVSFIIAQKD